MPVIINGSTGISGTDGSASTPAFQGTDSNTGVFFPAADEIGFAEGGTEVLRITSSGSIGSPQSPFVYSWQGGSPAGVRSGVQLDGANQQLLFFTGTNERARLDVNGYFTTPSQPCFTVYGGNNFTTTGSQQTVVFTGVVVNVGSCYNASNGRFTAPVAGNYFFTCTFVQMGTATGPVAYILKNNAQVSTAAIGYSDAYASASVSAIINMAPGDFVNVSIIAFNSSFSTIDMGWSGFSGFLMG